MADYIKCDGGCEKISPDNDGHYIANHWRTVIIIKPFVFGRRSEKKEYIFCKECFKRVEQSLQPQEASHE